jgi:serine/threonine protein kinase
MHRHERARQRAFGPYEILTSIGRGGGGEVYRAWDPRLRREVALKILRDQADSNPERVTRFVREARAASALNHPNIVTVFDASVEGDSPYIVSELIDGPTLRDEMARGPVPIKRMLDLATQIADGLAAAHEAGIVHRDLKPENIMLTRAGRVKILDFGLAWSGAPAADDGQAVELGSQTQTEPGLRTGTVPYMSPEQARGAASDFRSDQFSFGLIVYELATGRPAFRRDTPAATLHAIINDDVPLAGIQGRLPLLLQWIVERCLAKDPGERYGTTADLHRDLRTLRDRLGEAVAREGGTAAPRVARWRRAALFGLPLLAIGAIAAAAWSSGADDSGATPRFMPLTTAPEYEGFPAWSPDGNAIAYAAEVRGVLQIFQRDPLLPSPSPVTDAPFDCRSPFWSHDGKRIYYVSPAEERDAIWSVPASGGRAQVLVRNAAAGAISPDGQTIAFLREESNSTIVGALALYLSTPGGVEPWPREAVEAAARKVTAFEDYRFVEGMLAFSPDGRRLGLYAVGSFQMPVDRRWWQFWVVPVDGGAPVRRLRWLSDQAAPRVSSFTWMPDGRHAVLALQSMVTFRSHLWLVDLERDQGHALTSTPVGEAFPSASPTGNELVYTKDDSDYDVVQIRLAPGGSDRGPGRPEPILQSSRNESDPVWSTDGRMAYVTDRSGQDEIWARDQDGRLGDRPLITQRNFSADDPTIMLGAPTFSPNGQLIAFLRTGKEPIRPLRIWYGPVTGGTASALLPLTDEVFQTAPTWSPDGQWIAFAEWSAGLWRLVKVRVGSETRVELRADGVPNATPQWSPLGEWITWETADGFMLVSPDGTRQQLLSDDRWHAHAWARDGSEVYGIRETEDLHLSLVAVSARTAGRTRVLADLGPSPPANNPVKGLSVSRDGRTLVTSLLRLRGDLWVLTGLQWKTKTWWEALGGRLLKNP